MTLDITPTRQHSQHNHLRSQHQNVLMHAERETAAAPNNKRTALHAYDNTKHEAAVRLHAPLVRKLAIQLCSRLPANIQVDDLIQAGMLGLLDALERYRETPSAQFKTYATQRIRGAMLDELRSLDWAPRGVRERARRLEDAVHTVTQRLGRQPTETEIAHELRLKLADYRKLLVEAHGAQILPLDEFEGTSQIAPSNASAWPDEAAFILEAGDEDGPLAALAANELRSALTQAINALPERERLLLSLSYEQGLNLKEIGLVLDVGEARVCQLRTQAIARIRAHLKTLLK